MTSPIEIASCEWPLLRLGEAIAALGAAGLDAPTAGEAPRPPAALETSNDGSRALGRWIEAAAAWLGMEAEPASIAYSALPQQLCQCGPAIVRQPLCASPRRRRRGFWS
jgi:ATP-binding cassette subfamily B protein